MIADEGKVNINQAGIEELTTLPGVDETLAGRIIEYRETVHLFEASNELVAVPGFSEQMVREIENQLTVETQSEIEMTEEGAVEEKETTGSAIKEVEEAQSVPLTTEPELEPMPAAPGGLAPSSAGEETAVNAYIYSAAAGAVLGAVLTLLFLLLVNGTLRFAGNGRADKIEERFDQNWEAVNQAQDRMTGDVNGISSGLNTLIEEAASIIIVQETIVSDLSVMQTEVAALRVELVTTQEDVTALDEDNATLEETTEELDERLSVVAGSAENFDAFLNNLRDLLVNLQGLPPTLAATTTITATHTPTAAATDTPEEITAPTRTRRPTATSLAPPSDTLEATVVSTRTRRPAAMTPAPPSPTRTPKS